MVLNWRSAVQFGGRWRVLRLLTLAALLLLTATALGQDLVIVGATVYPSPVTHAIPNATIVIHDGKITSVVSGSSLRPPVGSKVLDCTGLFITAGFWNSHIHIFTPVLLHAATAKTGDLQPELDAMLNRWGFTTVFDVGSPLDNTLALRRRIESGEIRGPRMYTVGEPLWTAVPVYVRNYLVEQHVEMPTVETSSDAVARVQSLSERGADGIKLFTGSLQAHGSVANMSVEMVRASVKEAHRHRLPVFAHPQNSAGVEAAIQGGVDILAHTVPDSPEWTEQFVDRLTKAHMALIPTLTLYDFEARKGGDSDEEREQWIRRMTGELRAFVAGKGQVLFGTDVGYTNHFDTTMEFDLMHQAGMDYRQVLAALTTNPSERFGVASHAGMIAPGYDGDLTILEADPAADVRNLARVRYTVRSGRLIYSELAASSSKDADKVR